MPATNNQRAYSPISNGERYKGEYYFWIDKTKAELF
jgi:hypothetical protein